MSELREKEKRYYSIQLLRFVFCVVIVNYHFFSYYLQDTVGLKNFFCRGYLGDEFFFMVSGFFFAKAVMKSEKDENETRPFYYTLRRISKIAILYYTTWLLCFVGGRISEIMSGNPLRVISSLLNSIYELTFVEMLGFKDGLYSNVLSWYFSALIISIFVIYPFLQHFKKKYLLFIAPLLGFSLLARLSMEFDYLYYPSQILPNFPIMKGMVRAFADVNMGVFIFGIIEEFKGRKISAIQKRGIRMLSWILWVGVLAYVNYPFESNTAEITIQYDYIFTIVIFIALLTTFFVDQHTENKGCKSERIKEVLGRISVYVFFGQAIPYTMCTHLFALDIRTRYKFLLLYLCVIASSFIIWQVDRLSKCYSISRKMKGVGSNQ